MQCCLQVSRQSRGSKDIPGSSLDVLAHTAFPAVWEIPWTSQDLPWMSANTQLSILCGGSLGHLKILPKWFECRWNTKEDHGVPLGSSGQHVGLSVDGQPERILGCPWDNPDSMDGCACEDIKGGSWNVFQAAWILLRLEG